MKLTNFAGLALACLLACNVAGLAAPAAAQAADPVQAIQSAADPARLQSLLAAWQASSDPDAAFYAGLILHNLAIQDAARWAESAVASLAAYRGGRYAALALAYRGSAVTLLASVDNQRGNVVAASSRLNSGFALMDQAVLLDGQDLAIRFLRLENGLAISETTPFSRQPAITADLQAIGLAEASLDPASRALYYLACARLKLLQRQAAAALACLYRAIDCAPQSAAGRQARQLLARLEE